MKRIRQATDIIGIIERGDVNADLTTEIETTLKTLQELAPPKGKGVKGSVSVTLNFEVSGDSVAIGAEIKSKVPKRQRSSSHYFLTADAEISTEHPTQENMFDPRVVRDRDAG